MRLVPNDRSPLTRSGFTLVELLVVIAIIAILFSLTTAAAVKVITAADETRLRTEIAQIEVAVKACKDQFKVDRIPSRIWLDESMQYSSPPPGVSAQLAQDSKTFLSQMWPNLIFNPSQPGFQPIDWNGDNNTNGSFVLEGDQCLVFFLGGIPGPSGAPATTRGFSTNKRNPAWHIANGGDTVLPFFEFKSNRLARLRTNNPFFSYLDPFGRADGNGNPLKGAPYAYFSSSKAGNDYNRYASLGHDCVTLTNPPLSLGLADGPYRESDTPIFHNRASFQIISAGVDGKFGPGGLWTPATATNIPVDGRDDMANFYDRKLGLSP